MARKDDSKPRQDAARVAQWLIDHRSEFEDQRIREDSLASAIGLSREEVTASVDNLENREEVVRVPQALSTPPQFVLKPGRGWPNVRDEVLGKSAGD